MEHLRLRRLPDQNPAKPNSTAGSAIPDRTIQTPASNTASEIDPAAHRIGNSYGLCSRFSKRIEIHRQFLAVVAEHRRMTTKPCCR